MAINEYHKDRIQKFIFWENIARAQTNMEMIRLKSKDFF